MKKLIKLILRKIYLFSIINHFYRFLARLIKKISNYFFPSAIILTYHRVANFTIDPHQLAVSPENFMEQINYKLDIKTDVIYFKNL